MRGFTIVEMLVSVAIIALLIAIAIPTLGAARTSAARLRCEGHVRSSAMAIAAYAASYDDAFPMIAERRLRNAFRNGDMLLPYFLQRVHWPIA